MPLPIFSRLFDVMARIRRAALTCTKRLNEDPSRDMISRVAAPPAPATPPYWTRRREQRREWLRRAGAVSLAELYEGAVIILETRQPGYVRFVSHAVREIANRLPGIIDAEHAPGRVQHHAKLE